MKTVIKKLVTIVSESALEEILAEDFKKLGAHGYTVTEARGEGSRGKRAADWDQNRNIRIEVVCDDAVKKAIVQHLVDYYYENYAMVVYVSDVEVIRPEKF